MVSLQILSAPNTDYILNSRNLYGIIDKVSEKFNKNLHELSLRSLRSDDYLHQHLTFLAKHLNRIYNGITPHNGI